MVDIDKLLTLEELPLAEEEGVEVVVAEEAPGEDIRKIVIIKVLLLRFKPLNKLFITWQDGLVVYLDLHVFTVRDV